MKRRLSQLQEKERLDKAEKFFKKAKPIVEKVIERFIKAFGLKYGSQLDYRKKTWNIQTSENRLISIKAYQFYSTGTPFLSIFGRIINIIPSDIPYYTNKKIKIYQDGINEDSLAKALLEVKKWKAHYRHS